MDVPAIARLAQKVARLNARCASTAALSARR
jgi:hypothetical protein